MANFYGKDRDTDFAAAKLMSFGKSFSRMNGQPLDESEVWYNKADLEAFAAGNSAYVGMKLVYVDEANEKVYQYSVQYDGSVKEIGVAPLGDEKSIVVDAETGTVSLMGISGLVFEREVEGEDGTTTTEAVQYQPLMTAAGLVWVEPSKTTVEGLATLIEALTARVGTLENKVGAAAGNGVEPTGLYKLIADETARATEAEEALDAKIGAAAEGETAASGVYAAIAEALAEAKEYADDNDANTVYGIEYDSTNKKIKLVVDGTGTEIDATPFIKDGMIETVALSEDGKNLIITWNTEAGKDETTIPLSGLIDVYTSGNGGIKVENNTISAVVKTDDKYLEVTETGLASKGIDDAIAAAEGRAATDATTKAATAKSEAIADADAKLANKANVADVYAKTETYSQEEIDDLLEGIQGGASESAASVNTKLENFKKSINAEVYGNEEGTGESRIDALEAVGAQANVIEAVVASNGTGEGVPAAKLTATLSGKTVTLNDAALQTAISNADAKGAQGIADAAAAKGIADANTSAIGTINTNLTNNYVTNTSLSNTLANYLTSDEVTETYLTKTDAGTTYLTKTDANTTYLAKADAETAYAPKGEFETLKNTAALAANVYSKTEADNLLNAKANASDVYTKTEIGTIESGKSLVDMITAAGDTSALEARVKANEDAIAAIDYVDNDELAAAIKVETDRADAEEKRLAGLIEANATAIAGNTAVINSILGNDDETDLNSIAELAAWINEHGTEAENMAKAITANETAIKTINDTTIPAAITEAKGYTDSSIAALNIASYKVKDVDNTTLAVSEAGVASIKAVNTDLLAQGSEELVLVGGNAGQKVSE